LQQVCRRIPAPAAKIKRPGKAADLRVLVQIERSFSLSTEVQQKRHTVPGTGAGVGTRARVCEIRNAGNDLTKQQLRGGNLNPPSQHPRLADIACCNVLKMGENRGLVLQDLLPGVLERSEENL